MERSHLKKLVYGVSAMLALAACGDSKGGGVAEFKTVMATASGPAAPLDVDVARWVDSTGAAATPCVAGSIPSVTPSDVTINVATTPYVTPNTNTGGSAIPASPIVLENVTVTLSPADAASQALQSQVAQPLGQIVQPGGTLPITVRVVSDTLKMSLQPTLNCTNTLFHYYATFSIDAVEVNTGKKSTITTPRLLVTLGDFADK